MKTIPQRVLRNQSASVLREAEAGERFTITVGGRPVAQLGPLPRRQWVPKAEYGQLLRREHHDPAFQDDVADLDPHHDELEERWEPPRR
jgi:prevent-host-death family protein